MVPFQEHLRTVICSPGNLQQRGPEARGIGRGAGRLARVMDGAGRSAAQLESEPQEHATRTRSPSIRSLPRLFRVLVKPTHTGARYTTHTHHHHHHHQQQQQQQQQQQHTGAHAHRSKFRNKNFGTNPQNGQFVIRSPSTTSSTKHMIAQFLVILKWKTAFLLYS